MMHPWNQHMILVVSIRQELNVWEIAVVLMPFGKSLLSAKPILESWHSSYSTASELANDAIPLLEKDSDSNYWRCRGKTNISVVEHWRQLWSCFKLPEFQHFRKLTSYLIGAGSSKEAKELAESLSEYSNGNFAKINLVTSAHIQAIQLSYLLTHSREISSKGY